MAILRAASKLPPVLPSITRVAYSRANADRKVNGSSIARALVPHPARAKAIH